MSQKGCQISITAFCEKGLTKSYFGCWILLPSIGPQNGDIFLVLVVVGFFDDIMPLLVRDIHEEEIARFMILDGVLEFLRHHFFPEEPAGVAMGGIAVHSELIGELFE